MDTVAIKLIAQPEYASERRRFFNHVHALKKAAWKDAERKSQSQEECHARYKANLENLSELGLLALLRGELHMRRKKAAAELRKKIAMAGPEQTQGLRAEIQASDLGPFEAEVSELLEQHSSFLQAAARSARKILGELRGGSSPYLNEVPAGAKSFFQRGNKIMAFDSRGRLVASWGVDASGVAYLISSQNGQNQRASQNTSPDFQSQASP